MFTLKVESTMITQPKGGYVTVLASKQIAALVEIQTFKSSSNITASLRQHLTLGVKYSYCFFLLLSRQTSPSWVNIYVNQSEDTVRVY